MNSRYGHGFYPKGDLGRVRIAALDSRRLHLIVFLTEACNCRCVYCYQDFARGKILPHVVDGIKALITARAPDLEALEIGWFGGEPLLAWDEITEISEHVKEMQALYQFDVVSTMSTNALLLKEDRLRYLSESGLQVLQITLDGPKPTHNVRRPTQGGGETFDVIWDRLESIRDSSIDVEVILRIHVDPGTVHEIEKLQPDIERAFGADPRFRFHYVVLENYEQAASQDVRRFVAPEGMRVIERLNAFHKNPGKSLTRKDAVYVCYAGTANSFAVRTDGALLKCTVKLDDPQNIVGWLKASGGIEFDVSRLRPWLQGLESLDAKTLACPASKFVDSPQLSPVYLLHQRRD